MKRTIALIFLLIFTTPYAMAATTTCQERTPEECMTSVGCAYSTNILGNWQCQPCPAGYYGTSIRNQCDTSCIPDAVKESADALDLTFYTTNISQPVSERERCQWQLNCPAGTYWGGPDNGCKTCPAGTITPYESEIEFDAGDSEQDDTYSYSTIHYTECITCGQNAKPNSNKTRCVCNTGYKVDGSILGNPITETTDGTDCVQMKSSDYPIKEYKIYLNRPWEKEDNEFIYLYVRAPKEYIISYTQVANYNDFGTQQQEDNFINTNKITKAPDTTSDSTQYAIARYLRTNVGAPTVNDCYKSEYENIGLTPGEAPSAFEAPNDDEQIYLCWTYKSYNVEYYIDDKKVYSQSNCSYNEICDTTTLENNDITWPKGKTVSGWECLENCDSETYDFGDQVTPATGAANNSTVKLQLKTAPCAAGYYCNNNTQTPCPAGTTSAPGASTQNKCGISSKTKFAGKNQTLFSLDIGDKIIPYPPPTTQQTQ